MNGHDLRLLEEEPEIEKLRKERKRKSAKAADKHFYDDGVSAARKRDFLLRKQAER